MKTFKEFVSEGFGPDCPEQSGPVTKAQATSFIKLWKSTTKKFFQTTFDFSNHFVTDRLNHERNSTQISTCELTFVLNKFFVKYAKQFKQDAEDVRNGVANPRGKNKEKLKPNELEYVVTSKSTDINLIFVLKNDFGKRGTAVILPTTVMRKRGFVANKGIHVFVEGVEYDQEEIYTVE